MQLLKLRYFQLKRDPGVWVLIIAGAAFYLSYYISSAATTYSLVFAACCAVALAGYHINRIDFDFIHHYLDKTRKQILLNYTILMLPFSSGLIAAGHLEHAVGLQIFVAVISQLRPKISTQKFSFLQRLIPPEHFEWISGVRRNFYFILVFLLVAIILSPVKFFGLLALFLLNITFLGFYNFYEPLLMLNPRNLPIQEFLREKTDYTLKVVLVVNTPLLLVNSIFHFESSWFCLCFIFGFSLLASCAVYLKYAYYHPNGVQGFRIDFLILITGVLVPYLLPLCIYVYYSSRKKAILNLSHYLHDTR